jgi:hypothetical protein
MEIPYRKIIIYLLTFAAYTYTGIGSTVLRNLRDAVLSAESVFGDMFKNVITVAEKFRSLHDIFDAAVEEECVFSCPEGKLMFIINLQYFHLLVINKHLLTQLLIIFNSESFLKKLLKVILNYMNFRKFFKQIQTSPSHLVLLVGVD